MYEDIYALLNQAKSLFQTDIEQSREVITKAVELAGKSNSREILSEVLIHYSQIISEQGVSTEVLERIFEAIGYLKKLDRKDLLIKALSTLSSLYLRAGDFDRAMSRYRQSLDLSKEMGEIEERPHILLGIGTVLYYKGMYSDAIEYFKQSDKSSVETGNSEVQIRTLNNLGCTYRRMGHLDLAEEILQCCIDLSLRDNLYNIIVPAMDELGLIHMKRGDEHRALEIWEKAIDIDKNRGGTFTCIAPHINLADYYMNKLQWEEAEKYIEYATKISKSANSRIDLLEIYKLETRISEKKGNYKRAYKYFTKTVELEREFQERDSVRELKEMELETMAKSRDRILTLSRIGQEITGHLDLEIMLNSIYTNIAKLMDFNILGIANFNRETSRIHYELFMSEGKRVENFVTDLHDRNSLAAWCVRNDSKVVISDFENESSEYIDEIKDIATYKNGGGKFPQSVIYMPLRVKGEIIGLFTIQSARKSAFTSVDLDTIEILTSYSAIGLNNAMQSEMIKEQNNRLTILATTDSLTGLLNRRAFFSAIERSCSWIKRGNNSLSLLILDLDHFKSINDTHGHPAGDYCIVEVSKIVKSVVKRDTDFVARLGGEEFGVFLSNCDRLGAKKVAEEIRSQMEGLHLKFDNVVIPVTVSIGYTSAALSSENSSCIDDIVIEADKALYAAKRNGRNRVCEY